MLDADCQGRASLRKYKRWCRAALSGNKYDLGWKNCLTTEKPAYRVAARGKNVTGSQNFSDSHDKKVSLTESTPQRAGLEGGGMQNKVDLGEPL